MGAVRNQLKKEGLSKKTIDVIADALEAQGEFTSLGWVDVASAATTNIGAANSPNVRITGTTTITGLGTVASGTKVTIRFADALTFTHNATSLILPGAANIATAANDTADMVSLGSGNWICTSYKKASGGGLPYKLFEAYISHASSAGSSTYTVLNDDIGVTAGHNWTYGDKFLFPYSDYKKIVVRPVTKDGTIVHMTPSYQSNQININLYDSSFLNTTGEYYVEIRSYE